MTAVRRRRKWTLTQLTVAFDVLPAGLRGAPEEVRPLGEGEVDTTWDGVQRHGLVCGAPSRGWYPVVCPQQHLHSPGPGATKGSDYKPSAGGGVFRCLHEHCIKLTAIDLRAHIFLLDIPDLEGFGQRLQQLIVNAPPAATAQESVRFRQPGAPPTEDEIRDRVIESYVHVEVQNKYWSVRSRGLVERASIDDRMTATLKRTTLLHRYSEATGNRLADMAVSSWLRQQPDLERVANVTHRLGQPLVVDNCINIAPPIPPPIELEGVPEPWLDLVDFVCGADADADLVLDWLALMAAAWDEKPGWHLLLKGEHGTGKNLLLSPLKWYTAPEHWYGMTVKDVEGGFTPFLARRFVTLDELMMTTRGAISTHDIYNSVKAWTARGTGFQMINEKHLKPYAALDLSGWAITSNAQVPLPLEAGDRRWLVIETPRQPRSESYYKDVVRWLEDNNGLVIGWLQQRWRTMDAARREVVRGTAPMTTAKRELILNSAEGIEGAVRLAIEGTYGDSWPDLMSVGDVQGRLRVSDLVSDQARRSMTTKRVAMALKAAGAVQMFEGKSIEESANRRTVRLWCLRPDLLGKYKRLGQGKALIEEYDRQQRGVTGVPVTNVVSFKPFPAR